MRALFALGAAILMYATDAQCCERSLLGTWKSDGETSMSFIRSNTILQPKTDRFLAALLGHMTMTFAADELHVFMPDVQMPLPGGQLQPFAGFEERKAYKILFCSKSTIVWSAKLPFDGEDEATTFTFIDPNTIWIYLGSVNPKIPDLHAREYFRRVR